MPLTVGRCPCRWEIMVSSFSRSWSGLGLERQRWRRGLIPTGVCTAVHLVCHLGWHWVITTGLMFSKLKTQTQVWWLWAFWGYWKSGLELPSGPIIGVMWLHISSVADFSSLKNTYFITPANKKILDISLMRMVDAKTLSRQEYVLCNLVQKVCFAFTQGPEMWESLFLHHLPLREKRSYVTTWKINCLIFDWSCSQQN